MNIKESKEKMLHYIREAYANNREIAPALNQDYTSSHNLHANLEQKFLTVTLSKIEKRETVTPVLENEGDTWAVLPLPETLYQVKGMKKGKKAFRNYVLDGYRVKVPAKEEGPLEVIYLKTPEEIKATTPDSYEYEIPLLYQELIPLKCAVMIAMEEKLSVAQFLEDQYRFRLSQLLSVERTNASRVQNRLWR